MLRGWRMRFPRIFDVWHKRTVTHSPDIRPIRNLQELVHNYSASFLCAEERGDKRARHSSGSPHQRAAWNWGRVSQENLVLCHALDPGVKLDLHAGPSSTFCVCRPRLSPSSGRITGPECTSTTRNIPSLRLG